MRIAVGPTNSLPLEKAKALAQIAETGHFSRVWVGEEFNAPDVFIYTHALLAATEHVNVAIGITSPYVRHPAVVAAASAFLSKDSSGRFSLGICVGGLGDLEGIGVTPEKPVETLQETASILRGCGAMKESTGMGDTT